MKIRIKEILGLIILLSLVMMSFSFISKFFSNENAILKNPSSTAKVNVLFLHHSTGKRIWDGGVEHWFTDYNKEHNTKYEIIEQAFPKRTPYGWNNYPYDYWNIWVNNSGEEPFNKEPTLEMITKKYDVIILKHCFPVANVKPNIGQPDIASDEKRLENYKLQYHALLNKMNDFNQTKFIIWTIPALVKGHTTPENAQRAKEFYLWSKNEFDKKDDNVFLWDFYTLETEGGLYLKNQYAVNENNSHPNDNFSKKVAPLFCQRIIDVIENRGDLSDITGLSD